ncbi:MAG: glycosyltransferase, partial [Bacteroidales bacterium]|nr:glycosyltransferase [Bacteroidales bacterium]
TFEKVVDFMDQHPDAGGLGVKMLDGKGNFLPESKRGLPTPNVAFYKIFGLSKLFPKSKIFGRYHLGFLDNNQTHQVEILSGAFMLMRKETLDKTGLLDEDYFMYGEDIDLSYRILKAGYKNYYFPHTRIIHYKGESTKKSSVNYVFVFYRAMAIFAAKHFSARNARLFSILINLAIYFRASIAIANRFFKRIFWPLTDTALFIGGLFAIKEYWETKMIVSQAASYYPEELLRIAFPIYALVCVASIYLNGGYDKPMKYLSILRGIAIGAVTILVFYALLPEYFRFSRAIILLGALWAVIATIVTRTMAHLIKYKNLSLGNEKSKRFAVVGSHEEATRIAAHLRSSSINPSLIALVNVDHGPQTESELGMVGHIGQLKEIAEIYAIDEIIFCAKDLSSQTIIDQMSLLKNPDLNFRIAPPESLFIIGSNSIDVFGDIYTININSINHPANRRNKRLMDLGLSIVLLIGLPLFVFIINKPFGFIKNVVLVLLHKKTWVGYNNTVDISKLPSLPEGVLSSCEALKGKHLDNQTIKNLNSLYSKDYKTEKDFLIFWKGFKNLGRQ